MPVAIKEATQEICHFSGRKQAQLDLVDGREKRLRVSVGGGTGNLRSVDGDVPAAILNREKISESVEKQTVDNHTYLRIMSWNAAGMKDESLRNLLDLLAAKGQDWDVVLVQEGPKRDAEELNECLGGHLWFVAPCGNRPRSVATLLNARWCRGGTAQPKFTAIDGRLATVVVHMHGILMCLMTSHLPHGGRPDNEYEAALACLEEAVKQAH